MQEELKPSSKAVHFEGAKLHLKQDSRGYVLSVLVHPNDVPIDLMLAPINTRYTIAMVEMADDGSIVTPRHKTEGERLVTSSVMLSDNSRFFRWLLKTNRIKDEETSPEKYIKDFCHIGSRSEFKSNETARNLFKELRSSFQADVDAGKA